MKLAPVLRQLLILALVALGEGIVFDERRASAQDRVTDDESEYFRDDDSAATECECDEPATLFEWSGCCEEEDDGDEPDTIETDRPDFTEASTTVGRGRVQFEMGYTFTEDNDGVTRTSNHSYPELLIRIGLFREWFELRIANNMAGETLATGGISDSDGGMEDMYLGCKIALSPQCGWLPEMALMLQMTVPTGADDFTDDEVLPGLNWLYGWDVTEHISCGGSTQGNRARDDGGHFYTEFAQSMTIGYGLTDRLGAYTEWSAFFPHSALAPDTKPQHYFDGGFTYLVTDNFQLDIRGGVGLNDAADDYFVGSGLSVRF